MRTRFEAALTWEDGLPSYPGTTGDRRAGIRREVQLEERGEGFGLLEADPQGWTLCIPEGAEAELSVDEAPIDVGSLRSDASGERRVRVCPGLRAHVRLGDYRFEVRPAA
jgi:hypothetical protein